jgi:hypothetical protein
MGNNFLRKRYATRNIQFSFSLYSMFWLQSKPFQGKLNSVKICEKLVFKKFLFSAYLKVNFEENKMYTTI